jgi:hypothetical protein
MKITIESYSKIHSTQFEYDDCSLEEYIDTFFNLLIANGFDPDCVKDGFKEFVQTKEELL